MAEIAPAPRRVAQPAFRRLALKTPQLSLPLTVIVAVMFGVSGGLLWNLGLNYEGISGSALSKIHPSTYMLVALCAWAAIASGNPVGYAVHVARPRPGSLFLLMAALLIFAQLAARGAPGLAGTIDTNIAPPLMVMLMVDVDERGKRRIEIAIHVLMTINALMGIGEFLSGHLVFPYRFDGEVFPTDTRSTALQGHPLANATIGCWYVLSLMSGGGPSMPKALRLPAIGLQLAGLVTYGGRSGIVIALALGAVCGFLALHRTLRRGRVPLLGAAGAVFVMTLLPLAVGAIASAGFFDALLLRFQSDGGSANARIEMFDLFSQIPLRDLIIGPDATLVDSLRRVAGLEWGIENPIIRGLLYNGAIMTALWALAIALFLWELVRLSGRGALLPMLGFLILINTSESIGGKTTMLTKFAVTMLCLYPLPAGIRRERHATGQQAGASSTAA